MRHVGRVPLALCVLSIALVACRTAAPQLQAAAADGDGDGVRDDVDLCPHAPEDHNGLDDWDGCPEGDADRDGIPDPKDACPHDPEDRDSFEDTDGCPELDNDHDRLPDPSDKCPNEPEHYNNFEDDDGCPDRAPDRPYVPRPPRPQLKNGPILFDEGSARIRSDAAEILDSIAAFVKAVPAVQEVTITGHAAAYEDSPPALAAARAEAVRRTLIRRGVPDGLIRVRPYGADTWPGEQRAGGCEYRCVDVFVIGR